MQGSTSLATSYHEGLLHVLLPSLRVFSHRDITALRDRKIGPTVCLLANLSRSKLVSSLYLGWSHLVNKKHAFFCSHFHLGLTLGPLRWKPLAVLLVSACFGSFLSLLFWLLLLLSSSLQMSCLWMLFFELYPLHISVLFVIHYQEAPKLTSIYIFVITVWVESWIYLFPCWVLLAQHHYRIFASPVLRQHLAP